MKILFCTNAFDEVSNGPAKFAHLVLKINTLFPEHQIQILTEDVETSSHLLIKQKLVIPKMFKFAGMFLRMFQYFSTIKKLNAITKYDVIVFNNAIIGMWAAFKLKNVVGMVNDDNQAVASYRNFIRTLKFNKNLIFYFVEKITCRILPSVIVNSTYMQNLLIHKYDLKKNKVHLLYKCIEMPKEVKFKLIQKQNPTILFVKNDFVRGGLFQLIDALKILNQPVILKVIGPHEIARKIMMQYLGKSKIQLHFLGIQSQETVLSEMKAADLFCVPSLREALGIANLEAMSIGCPIVTTSAGGIPEVMNHGKCGWIAKPNDPNDLALQISACFENDSLREEKRKYAFEFVKKFSVESTLIQFINILIEIANKKK